MTTLREKANLPDDFDFIYSEESLTLQHTSLGKIPVPSLNCGFFAIVSTDDVQDQRPGRWMIIHRPFGYSIVNNYYATALDAASTIEELSSLRNDWGDPSVVPEEEKHMAIAILNRHAVTSWKYKKADNLTPVNKMEDF